MQYYLKIIVSDPSIYTMDHPGTTVSNFMENSIALQSIKGRMFRNRYHRLMDKYYLV